MSKTEKPKGDNQQDSVAAASANRSYYVQHLKEYRSIKDLTQEDRESIADRLFGPSESKARDDLIQQMKKLAGEKKESK